MAHVVTARCVDCRYTDCVEACPVDCFWEIKDPHMLVIDPDTCIDCTLCIPECPIGAIWTEDELPEEYSSWTQKNVATISTHGALACRVEKDQTAARPVPNAMAPPSANTSSPGISRPLL